MSTQDDLAEHLDSEARWRERVAEFPADARHARAAAALHALADEVRGYPDDAPIVAELNALCERRGLGVVAVMPNRGSFDTSQFRLHDAHEPADEFLHRLVAAASREIERTHRDELEERFPIRNESSIRDLIAAGVAAVDHQGQSIVHAVGRASATGNVEDYRRAVDEIDALIRTLDHVRHVLAYHVEALTT